MEKHYSYNVISSCCKQGEPEVDPQQDRGDKKSDLALTSIIQHILALSTQHCLWVAVWKYVFIWFSTFVRFGVISAIISISTTLHIFSAILYIASK